MNDRQHRTARFTMIQLVIVVLILAVLAGVLIPRVTDRMAQSRDARRLADITTIARAVEQYHRDRRCYPPANENGAYGGWDVSLDGDLVPDLVKYGYLAHAPLDPINDDTYHYRYYVYSKDTSGCIGDGPFYVLGIKNFETEEFKSKNTGFFKCTGRDWSTEFAYVTGGGATYQ